jgi:hypothetical protein
MREQTASVVARNNVKAALKVNQLEDEVQPQLHNCATCPKCANNNLSVDNLCWIFAVSAKSSEGFEETFSKSTTELDVESGIFLEARLTWCPDGEMNWATLAKSIIADRGGDLSVVGRHLSVGFYSDAVRAGDTVLQKRERSVTETDTLRENPIEGFQPGWPLAKSGYADMGIQIRDDNPFGVILLIGHKERSWGRSPLDARRAAILPSNIGSTAGNRTFEAIWERLKIKPYLPITGGSAVQIPEGDCNKVTILFRLVY